jgi:N,N-dimethylformamidase
VLKIVGYTDRLSARPGETIAFKVSCEAGADAYDAEIIRLICGDDSPGGPGFKAEPVAASVNGRYPGRRQRVNCGSFGIVPNGVTVHGSDLCIAVLVQPTWLDKRSDQTLLACRDVDAAGRPGWSLMLDATGRPAMEVSNGRHQTTFTLDSALPPNRWSLIIATVGAQITLIHRSLQPTPSEKAVHSDTRPLPFVLPALRGVPITIAAELDAHHGDRLFTTRHFDGKLESPLLCRWLERPEQVEAIDALFDTCHARWDFAVGIDTQRIADVSGHGHDGILVNLPTRAVTGSNWHGQALRWTDRPDLYGAIHFHSDDLHDMQWETDFRWTVPSDLPSGVYATRVSCAGEGPGLDEDFLPFFVLPARDAAKAPVAFLASTFTFVAYANSHHGYEDALSEVCYGALLALGPAELFLKERRDFGISLYDRHRDGSGGVYSSWHRPILNTRPKRALWNFNADLHVVDWLHAIEQPFDVITDDRIHEEGVALLKDYRCVITGSHPEYHSTAMLDAFEAYLSGGGRLMYLGGNGFYWRVSTHPDLPGVIEVRRGEAGTRCFELPPGERYHCWGGEAGGLWRSQGRAPQQLVGVGFVTEGFDENSYFVRDAGSFVQRTAFIFDGIAPDERIGDFGVLGGAAGYELDAADPALGTPPHALVLAHSVEHSNVYLLTPEEMLAGFPGADAIEHDKVRAELVYFECPKGGAVFSTGSITWAASLSHNGYDNNVARITGNVLRRFADPAPLQPGD